MAALPSITQVAGVHLDLYEKYFQQVDKNRSGFISALDAAAFLKKSGLSDLILSKVWDLSDPTGKGSLDKAGFFVALKLVSLAQNNTDVSMANICLELPAPNMGDSNSITDSSLDWTIKPAEKLKFEQLFDSLGPVNGRLPGSKVKPVMINSKLPVDVLGRVWDLSDVDNDGFLDKDEFVLAMHLIYKALENHPVPSVLPPELVPPSKRKKSLVGAVPVLPFVPPAVESIRRNSGTLQSTEPSVTANSGSCSTDVPWVVSVVDKARYDAMFQNADLDGDGFVNGAEIKELFLQSCLPQPVLAHIWNLCDIKQTGKLNVEQFALAMHLVQEKLHGIEPPATLSPEMVPPTLRVKNFMDGNSSGDTTVTTNNCFNNPELELMNNEINDLQKEKKQMEDEVKQKESDVSIKKNEIRTLQAEFEALTAAVKQLETQKSEAQKRLDDLDGQQSTLEHSLSELKKQVEEETEEVDRLKIQLNTQAATLKEQETELNTKRQELNELRQEEAKLEQQIDTNKNQLNTLCKTLETSQLQIPQAKTKIMQLQEQQNELNLLISQYDTALSSGDVTSIGDLSLQTFTPITPDVDVRNNKQNGSVSSFGGVDAAVEGTVEDDPFQSKDPFADTNGFSADPFGSDDPFKAAEDSVSGVTEDPFGGHDPFKDVFGQTINEDDFRNSDPFSALPAKANSSNGDPFDPLGTGGTSEGVVNGSDPFGSDPFAPRSESPTPALPPKKSKQPPPRPAPPKSSGVKAPRAAPPAPDPFSNVSSKPNDPFSSGFETDPFDPFSSSAGKDSFGANDQFADFANFDKLSGWGTSEEQQLAWATVESLRLEKDRRKEEADFELALALSRAEVKNVTS